MKQKRQLLTSARMKRVKSRGTSLERKFVQFLRINGIRYVSHPRIFGHPDFRIKFTKLLIFCDSSFWHGRNKSEITGQAFKTNRNFWVKKLKYNKERDERINGVLKERGWKVLRFWDDDILKHPLLVLLRIKRYVKSSKK